MVFKKEKKWKCKRNCECGDDVYRCGYITHKDVTASLTLSNLLLLLRCSYRCSTVRRRPVIHESMPSWGKVLYIKALLKRISVYFPCTNASQRKLAQYAFFSINTPAFACVCVCERVRVCVGCERENRDRWTLCIHFLHILVGNVYVVFMFLLLLVWLLKNSQLM